MLPSIAAPAALPNAVVNTRALSSSNPRPSSPVIKLFIVLARPEYLLTMFVSTALLISPPFNSAVTPAAIASLTPSCKFSHPATTGIFNPSVSSLNSPRSVSSYSPVRLVYASSIAPSVAPTPAFRPPTANASNGF